MENESKKGNLNPGVKFIDTGDPDVLQTRSGGGCLVLFGLPFFLAGLFVMIASVGLIPLEGDPPPWYIGLPFGAVFACVGAGLMLGRAGLIIDRRSKTVVKWWGLVVPMKRTEHMLDYYNRVTLSREVRKGDKSSTTVYPVRLEGESGADPVKVAEPQDYQSSRKIAEDLAGFLNRQLVDMSSGKRVVREADALDESLLERTIRSGEIAFLPDAPADMKTRVREEGDSVILEMPPPGLNPAHYFQMGAAAVFVSFVTYQFLIPLAGEEEMGPPRYIFIGFISIFFVLMPIILTLRGVFSQARKWERVVASPEFLRVEEYGLRKKKVTRIPARELEELEVPEGLPLDDFDTSGDGSMKEMGSTGVPRMSDGRPAPRFLVSLARLGKKAGITARSDRATVRFGAGLSEEELKYIHAVIMKRMTG